MLKSVVKSYIYQKLGNFVYLDDLTNEQVNVELLSGKVQLRDVKIRPAIFDDLQLPFSCLKGNIGELSIDIPWTTLSTEPVAVKMKRATITFCPRPSQKEAAWELVHSWMKTVGKTGGSASSEPESDESTRPSTYFARLQSKIVDNLRIEIESIMFRYCDLSPPETRQFVRPFILGVAIQSLVIQTANANWHASFVDRNISHCPYLHRLVSFEGVRVFWQALSVVRNTGAKEGEETETAEEKETIKVGGEEVWYIIPDAQAEIRVLINDAGCHENRMVTANVSVIFLKEFNVNLSPMQCLAIDSLLGRITTFQLLMRRSFFRMKFDAPEVSVHDDPSAWWKYAARCVVPQKDTMSWTQLVRMVLWRRDYIPLLKRVIGGERYRDEKQAALAGVDSRPLERLEREMFAHLDCTISNQQRAFFRALAEGELDAEARLWAGGWRGTQKRGWFSFSNNKRRPGEQVLSATDRDCVWAGVSAQWIISKHRGENRRRHPMWRSRTSSESAVKSEEEVSSLGMKFQVTVRMPVMNVCLSAVGKRGKKLQKKKDPLTIHVMETELLLHTDVECWGWRLEVGSVSVIDAEDGKELLEWQKTEDNRAMFAASMRAHIAPPTSLDLIAELLPLRVTISLPALHTFVRFFDVLISTEESPVMEGVAVPEGTLPSELALLRYLGVFRQIEIHASALKPSCVLVCPSGEVVEFSADLLRLSVTPDPVEVLSARKARSRSCDGVTEAKSKRERSSSSDHRNLLKLCRQKKGSVGSMGFLSRLHSVELVCTEIQASKVGETGSITVLERFDMEGKGSMCTSPSAESTELSRRHFLCLTSRSEPIVARVDSDLVASVLGALVAYTSHSERDPPSTVPVATSHQRVGFLHFNCDIRQVHVEFKESVDAVDHPPVASAWLIGVHSLVQCMVTPTGMSFEHETLIERFTVLDELTCHLRNLSDPSSLASVLPSVPLGMSGREDLSEYTLPQGLLAGIGGLPGRSVARCSVPLDKTAVMSIHGTVGSATSVTVEMGAVFLSTEVQTVALLEKLFPYSEEDKAPLEWQWMVSIPFIQWDVRKTARLVQTKIWQFRLFQPASAASWKVSCMGITAHSVNSNRSRTILSVQSSEYLPTVARELGHEEEEEKGSDSEDPESNAVSCTVSRTSPLQIVNVKVAGMRIVYLDRSIDRMLKVFQEMFNVYNVDGFKFVPYKLDIRCRMEDIDILFPISEESTGGILAKLADVSLHSFPLDRIPDECCCRDLLARLDPHQRCVVRDSSPVRRTVLKVSSTSLHTYDPSGVVPVQRIFGIDQAASIDLWHIGRDWDCLKEMKVLPSGTIYLFSFDSPERLVLEATKRQWTVLDSVLTYNLADVAPQPETIREPSMMLPEMIVGVNTGAVVLRLLPDEREDPRIEIVADAFSLFRSRDATGTALQLLTVASLSACRVEADARPDFVKAGGPNQAVQMEYWKTAALDRQFQFTVPAAAGQSDSLFTLDLRAWERFLDFFDTGNAPPFALFRCTQIGMAMSAVVVHTLGREEEAGVVSFSGVTMTLIDDDTNTMKLITSLDNGQLVFGGQPVLDHPVSLQTQYCSSFKAGVEEHGRLLTAAIGLCSVRLTVADILRISDVVGNLQQQFDLLVGPERPREALNVWLVADTLSVALCLLSGEESESIYGYCPFLRSIARNLAITAILDQREGSKMEIGFQKTDHPSFHVSGNAVLSEDDLTESDEEPPAGDLPAFSTTSEPQSEGIALEVFNSRSVVWEPLVEPWWKFDTEIVRSGGLVAVGFDGEPLNLNVTKECLESIEVFISSLQHMHSKTSAAPVPMLFSHVLHNHTSYEMTVKIPNAAAVRGHSFHKIEPSSRVMLHISQPELLSAEPVLSDPNRRRSSSVVGAVMHEESYNHHPDTLIDVKLENECWDVLERVSIAQEGISVYGMRNRDSGEVIPVRVAVKLDRARRHVHISSLIEIENSCGTELMVQFLAPGHRLPFAVMKPFCTIHAPLVLPTGVSLRCKPVAGGFDWSTPHSLEDSSEPTPVVCFPSASSSVMAEPLALQVHTRLAPSSRVSSIASPILTCMTISPALSVCNMLPEGVEMVLRSGKSFSSTLRITSTACVDIFLPLTALLGSNEQSGTLVQFRLDEEFSRPLLLRDVLLSPTGQSFFTLKLGAVRGSPVNADSKPVPPTVVLELHSHHCVETGSYRLTLNVGLWMCNLSHHPIQVECQGESWDSSGNSAVQRWFSPSTVTDAEGKPEDGESSSPVWKNPVNRPACWQSGPVYLLSGPSIRGFRLRTPSSAWSSQLSIQSFLSSDDSSGRIVTGGIDQCVQLKTTRSDDGGNSISAVTSQVDLSLSLVRPEGKFGSWSRVLLVQDTITIENRLSDPVFVTARRGMRKHTRIDVVRHYQHLQKRDKEECVPPYLDGVGHRLVLGESSLPFHWPAGSPVPTSSALLCFALRGHGWDWSGGVSLSESTETAIKLHNVVTKETRVVRIRVSIRRCSILIRLAPEPVEAPLFQISNLTTDELLHVGQVGLNTLSLGSMEMVLPNSSIPFGWDEPSVSHPPLALRDSPKAAEKKDLAPIQQDEETETEEEEDIGSPPPPISPRHQSASHMWQLLSAKAKNATERAESVAEEEEEEANVQSSGVGSSACVLLGNQCVHLWLRGHSVGVQVPIRLVGWRRRFCLKDGTILHLSVTMNRSGTRELRVGSEVDSESFAGVRVVKAAGSAAAGLVVGVRLSLKEVVCAFISSVGDGPRQEVLVLDMCGVGLDYEQVQMVREVSAATDGDTQGSCSGPKRDILARICAMFALDPVGPSEGAMILSPEQLYQTPAIEFKYSDAQVSPELTIVPMVKMVVKVSGAVRKGLTLFQPVSIVLSHELVRRLTAVAEDWAILIGNLAHAAKDNARMIHEAFSSSETFASHPISKDRRVFVELLSVPAVEVRLSWVGFSPPRIAESPISSLRRPSRYRLCDSPWELESDAPVPLPISMPETVHVLHMHIGDPSCCSSASSSRRSESAELPGLSWQSPAIQTLIGFFLCEVVSVVDAPLTFTPLVCCNLFLDSEKVPSLISKHYGWQVIRQTYKMVGSAGAIGSPLGWVSAMKDGFVDLVVEPSRALVEGPVGLGRGLSRGVFSLLQRSVTATSFSASRVSRAIGSGVAMLSLDAQFIAGRQMMHRVERPTDFSGGLVTGSVVFGDSVTSGISGLFEEPIAGASTGGVLGFLLGLGRGVFGVALKPLVGVLDGFSKASEGLHNAVKGSSMRDSRGSTSFNAVTSSTAGIFSYSNSMVFIRRRPRVFWGEDQQLRPYDATASLALCLLKQHFCSSDHLRSFATLLPSRRQPSRHRLLVLTLSRCAVFQHQPDRSAITEQDAAVLKSSVLWTAPNTALSRCTLHKGRGIWCVRVMVTERVADSASDRPDRRPPLSVRTRRLLRVPTEAAARRVLEMMQFVAGRVYNG